MPLAVRTVLRSLGHRPAYSVLAVMTIAFGIGACTTAFAVVNAVLLSPLPFPAAAQLVWIGESAPDEPETGASFLAVDRWRRSASTLKSVGAFASRDMRLTSNGYVDQLPVTLVSGDFFQTLGVEPVLGRPIEMTDDRPGAAPVAVLSYALWQSRFASRRDIVGSVIDLDGRPREIVGVMPAAFRFPLDETAAWLPALPQLEAFANADVPGLVLVIGRLRVKTDVAAVEDQLRAIEQGASGVSRARRNFRPFVRTLREQLTRDIRPRVQILAGVAALMMILACANLATMLLTQVARRRQEIAVRQALGASRAGIIGQLVAENLLVGASGVLGGLALSAILLHFAGVYASDRLPELRSAELGRGGVLAAAVLGVTALATLGVVARYQVGDVAPAAILNEGAGLSGTQVGRRLRDVLVTSEVAVTALMLGSAAMLAKSYLALANTGVGMDTKHVYVASLARPLTVLTPVERPQVRAFMASFLEKAGRLPDLTRVAISTEPPGGGNRITSDAAIDGGMPRVHVGVVGVSSEYFAALRIPLRRGRMLDASDQVAPDKEPESIGLIDQTLAHRLFGAADPVGRTVTLRDLALGLRVVGVVGDVRQGGATEQAMPQVYVPYDLLPLPWVTVVVRSNAGPDAVHSSLKSVASQLDRAQPVGSPAPLARLLADQLDRSQFYTLLLSGFAVSSVLLTAIGLYGVIALLVTQRDREFGVRLSVGAAPRQIFLLVLRQSLRLAAVGLGVGVALAATGARLLHALLYGIDPVDPLLLGGCGLIVVIMALLAASAPACSAARRDPARIIRASP